MNKDCGNPNQPNFSYIPRTATSANDNLGPGYGPLVVDKGTRFPKFSSVPRFGNVKKPKTTGPSASYIKKFREWDDDKTHFSRRPVSPNKAFSKKQ